MSLRYIIRAVPWRAAFIKYLRDRMPYAEFCIDRDLCAYKTFQRSLEMAGEDPAVNMEEDIILTLGFREKLEAVVAKMPETVIQFFSIRPKDLTEGARWDNNYLMAQCTYFPAGYCREILDFSQDWREKNPGHDNGIDLMVQHFLKSRREPYWIHVPSLVDHRIARSAIDPRRSSKRQSKTFEQPWT